MFKGNISDTQDETITNNGFWPDISTADFIRQRGIPADIHPELVTETLISAVAEVNLDLQSYEHKQRCGGYQSAADLPGVKTTHYNQLTAQYKKAVYARAKADLLGEYASISRRETHSAQDSIDTKSRLLAEAALVIRNIKGLGRIGVSLL